jgi:hypothetical protein
MPAALMTTDVSTDPVRRLYADHPTGLLADRGDGDTLPDLGSGGASGVGESVGRRDRVGVPGGGLEAADGEVVEG